MNALVIYDSKYGNTERIAQAIAQTLSEAGAARAIHAEEVKPADLEEVNLLVLGCPTQAWHATSPMTTFISSLAPGQLERMEVACFDTRFNKPRWLTGSAAGNIARMVKKAGGPLLVPPESFFVEDSEGPLKVGEVEHAQNWADKLFEVFMERESLAEVI
jgi:flavodoxin